MSSNGGNGYYGFLNTAGRAEVSLTSFTHVRLRFTRDDDDDNSADYLELYGGEAATPANRPTLVIEYLQ